MRNLIFYILIIFLCLIGITKCVVEECPTNEVYFECGESCQRECSTIGKPCTIRHIKCPNGCYCDEGYARVSVGGGACVPIKECPGKSQHSSLTSTLTPEELGNKEQQKQDIRKMRRRPLKSSNSN